MKAAITVQWTRHQIQGQAKISEEGDVDVIDSTTIVNEISCMENPQSENGIEDNHYKNRNIGMHKKTQERIQQKSP